MGLFGRNIKFGDVIAGAADAINEQLKDDIKRTKTLADDIQMYHVKRRQEKAEKLEGNKEEIEDVLNNLASFVDVSKMSEGMNKYDYAAQLFSQAGTVDQANNLITTLTDARNKGVDTTKFINYAQTETGGYGLVDYMNKFVKRPSEVISLSDEVTKGVGLYKAFNPQNIGADIREAIEMAAPRSKDKIPDFLVPKATIDFKELPAAIEYKQQQETKKIQLRNATLQNLQLEKAINYYGILDGSEFRQNFKDTLAAQIRARGHIFDNVTGKIDYKGAGDKVKDAVNSHASALQANVVKAIQVGALGGQKLDDGSILAPKPDVINQMKSAGLQTLAYLTGKYKPIEPVKDDTIVGKIYKVKYDDVTADAIYVGGDISDEKSYVRLN